MLLLTSTSAAAPHKSLPRLAARILASLNFVEYQAICGMLVSIGCRSVLTGGLAKPTALA